MTTKKREDKGYLLVRTDQRTVQALKVLSARTRVPQSVYLREALDDLVAKYGKKGVRT
jgi:predicted DNA-binding protein